ncbi:MAG: hypothetical protein SGJ18_14465 [Pseudomonadota bacterium]|nr:hypothetical protein [Pseudomonadota bacterium]
MALTFRLAQEVDVWSLMALYQRVGSTYTEDAIFLDYQKLLLAVNSLDNIWVIAERDGVITTTISLMIDREQCLAKIARIIVNPQLSSVRSDLKDTIRYCIKFLEESSSKIHVLYCTTMTVPMQFQEVTLEEGFKILGIFPNAMGVDYTRLNGLTAYYFGNTLAEDRVSGFALHPELRPFFEISRSQLNLPDLPVANISALSNDNQADSIGMLEVVNAPNLVAAKFEKLRRRRRQMNDFYPFYKPNIMISSPDEDIQLFAKVIESNHFAAFVGEELLVAVNPAKLYQTAVQLLKAQNITYFEIINDAADTVGNQWLLEASFVPCCYIPAFKKQNEKRRDYVVFCKTFEYITRPDLKIRKPFLDFFREFFSMEWKNYVGTGELFSKSHYETKK